MELLSIRSWFLMGFAFLNLVSLVACQGHQDEQAEGKKGNKPGSTTNYSKPPSSCKDTLVIPGRAAVFFGPDSLQAVQIKNVVGGRIYESDAHEFYYLLRNARNVIKRYWPGVTVIETRTTRYLAFKRWKNTVFVDLDKRNEMCGLYLFDPAREPQLADMMNIDTELKVYFHGK